MSFHGKIGGGGGGGGGGKGIERNSSSQFKLNSSLHIDTQKFIKKFSTHINNLEIKKEKSRSIVEQSAIDKQLKGLKKIRDHLNQTDYAGNLLNKDACMRLLKSDIYEGPLNDLEIKATLEGDAKTDFESMFKETKMPSGPSYFKTTEIKPKPSVSEDPVKGSKDSNKRSASVPTDGSSTKAASFDPKGIPTARERLNSVPTPTGSSKLPLPAPKENEFQKRSREMNERRAETASTPSPPPIEEVETDEIELTKEDFLSIEKDSKDSLKKNSIEILKKVDSEGSKVVSKFEIDTMNKEQLMELRNKYDEELQEIESNLKDYKLFINQKVTLFEELPRIKLKFKTKEKVFLNNEPMPELEDAKKMVKQVLDSGPITAMVFKIMDLGKIISDSRRDIKKRLEELEK